MPRATINADKKRRRRIFDDDWRQFNVPPSSEDNEWVPEEWHRIMAARMAGIGMPYEQIATLFRISSTTLVKHLQEDLDTGIAQVNSLILNKMFTKMVLEGDGHMIRFYVARRLGWVEPKSDAPTEEQDFGDLSNEQLQAELEEIRLRKRASAGARGLEAPVPE